jgi:hypothetical protein
MFKPLRMVRLLPKGRALAARIHPASAYACSNDDPCDARQGNASGRSLVFNWMAYFGLRINLITKRLPLQISISCPSFSRSALTTASPSSWQIILDSVKCPSVPRTRTRYSGTRVSLRMGTLVDLKLGHERPPPDRGPSSGGWGRDAAVPAASRLNLTTDARAKQIGI